MSIVKHDSLGTFQSLSGPELPGTWKGWLPDRDSRPRGSASARAPARPRPQSGSETRQETHHSPSRLSQRSKCHAE